MNIFVTGASGFIGRHLLNEINLDTHRLFCIKTSNKKILVKNKKNIEWVTGCLSSLYTKYLKKTDILVHLASVSTNHPYKNLEKCIQVNILDSLKLSWEATDEHGGTLFGLTLLFILITLIPSSIFSSLLDPGLTQIIILGLFEYAIVIPWSYMYFSLYQSQKNQ